VWCGNDVMSEAVLFVLWGYDCEYVVGERGFTVGVG